MQNGTQTPETEYISYSSDEACHDSGGWVEYSEWRYMGQDCSTLRVDESISLDVCNWMSDWSIEPNYNYPPGEPYYLWDSSLEDAEIAVQKL